MDNLSSELIYDESVEFKPLKVILKRSQTFKNKMEKKIKYEDSLYQDRNVKYLNGFIKNGIDKEEILNNWTFFNIIYRELLRYSPKTISEELKSVVNQIELELNI